jgi:hypothetical protein
MVHRITSELNANSFIFNHLYFHPIIVRFNYGLLFDNLKIKFLTIFIIMKNYS